MAGKTKTKKEVKFRHGLLAFALLAAVMFGCVVGLGSEPQIPMVAGCAIAGAIAMYLGNSWEEVLTGAMKGVLDAMEAVYRYARGYVDSLRHRADPYLLRA